MAKPLNKRRASALFDEAKLLLRQGQADRAIALLQQVLAQSDLGPAELFAILGEAQRPKDPRGARSTLEAGLARHPQDPTLQAAYGSLLSELGEMLEAVAWMERAKGRLGRQSEFLIHYALVLLKAGNTAAADLAITDALTRKVSGDGRLVQGLVRARQGRLAEAAAIAQALEASNAPAELKDAAAGLRADVSLTRGESQVALAIWKQLDAKGAVARDHLSHMAYAAQLSADLPLADALIARCLERAPSADERLLFAQIALLRAKPQEALALLEGVDPPQSARLLGWDYEASGVRGRALRLLGRAREAAAALEAAAAMPEHETPHLGARVRIDLGHLAAEAGEFEKAEALFRAALEKDPKEPEALRALELTSRRVAWRSELEASAAVRVEAAQAEADALRRRFTSREAEVEALRRELQEVKAARQRAEDEARAAQEAARAQAQHAPAQQRERLREELETREREASEKALSNLERSLGPAWQRDTPPALTNLLLVAERTYQKALYTELPAAALAVLFSGALERSLYVLIVEGFDSWLSRGGRRQVFLEGAIRERRGRRVEYFDHFVEAFEKDRAGKAPSLGEVGRVLERRNERYLAPFRDFLAERFALPSSFYDELAQFVLWSKVTLRDPSAHGRGIELGYEGLRSFREQLLFSFHAHGKGALALLICGRTTLP